MVAKDERIKNAIKNSDKENIKIEYENVLADVIRSIMKDNMELFLQFTSNIQFKKWLSDSVFNEIMKKQKSFEEKENSFELAAEDDQNFGLDSN